MLRKAPKERGERRRIVGFVMYVVFFCLSLMFVVVFGLGVEVKREYFLLLFSDVVRGKGETYLRVCGLKCVLLSRVSVFRS
jgi:hypothetical protein